MRGQYQQVVVLQFAYRKHWDNTEKIEAIHIGIELVHVKILLNTVIHVLCTYKPPDKNLKVYTAQLCRHLQEKVPLPEECIVLGDFNDNLMSRTNSDLLQRMKSLGFKQHIQLATKKTWNSIRPCIQP